VFMLMFLGMLVGHMAMVNWSSNGSTWDIKLEGNEDLKRAIV
jgi:hypothetical protein